MHDIIGDILDWDEAHKAYLAGEGQSGGRPCSPVSTVPPWLVRYATSRSMSGSVSREASSGNQAGMACLSGGSSGGSSSAAPAPARRRGGARPRGGGRAPRGAVR